MECAVITGATSGLGKTIAKNYLLKGYCVIGVARMESPSSKASIEELQSITSGTFIPVVADLSDYEGIIEAVKQIKKATTNICVFVYCSGTTCRLPIEELKWDDHQRVMNVNVNSALFLIQQLIPLFVQSSAILLIGSVMAKYPHGMSVSYSLSKCAIEYLTPWLARNLAKYKIRVNCISPGFMDTEWQKQKPADQKERISKKTLAGRFGSPDEVASMAIAINDNDFMNGSVVSIDGGYGLNL